MAAKIEHLERTVLELGTEIYRVKHRMDTMERENTYFQDLILSLRSLLDEKGIINTEEFDEAVAIDRILAKQNAASDGLAMGLVTDIKKAIN